MKKAGDFQLSFSMVFSIIIIIAIIGIAFYVISNFLSLSKCTETGLFYEDLKKRVERAWQSPLDEESDALKGSTLPSSIKLVCFGNFTQSPVKEYKKQYDYFKRYARDSNVFLYPANKACDGELSSMKLEHITTDSFFCAPVQDNKVKIKIEKNYLDSLVKIQRFPLIGLILVGESQPIHSSFRVTQSTGMPIKL